MVIIKEKTLIIIIIKKKGTRWYKGEDGRNSFM
jgi:hypothetical protein